MFVVNEICSQYFPMIKFRKSSYLQLIYFNFFKKLAMKLSTALVLFGLIATVYCGTVNFNFEGLIPGQQEYRKFFSNLNFLSSYKMILKLLSTLIIYN